LHRPEPIGADEAEVPASPSVAVILWLGIENGSQFTRGKRRAKREIHDLIGDL
jgi:hypothetical protein